MKDIQIINDVLNGEVDKYSILMEKYHNELFVYIYNITNNYNDTEDLLQEVFFKIYKNIHKYDATKASFRTWMYRVSGNYVLNYLKSSSAKNNRHNSLYDDSLHASNIDVEQTVTNNSQIDEIVSVMKRVLNPKHLKIMSMHYFSSLSAKEISESLDIPLKTIYKAIKTSIQKIKKEVDTIDEI